MALGHLLSVGGVEPEPVARDRTAECAAVIPESLDRRACLQASRAQVVVEIVTLQRRGRSRTC